MYETKEVSHDRKVKRWAIFLHFRSIMGGFSWDFTGVYGPQSIDLIRYHLVCGWRFHCGGSPLGQDSRRFLCRRHGKISSRRQLWWTLAWHMVLLLGPTWEQMFLALGWISSWCRLLIGGITFLMCRCFHWRGLFLTISLSFWRPARHMIDVLVSGLISFSLERWTFWRLLQALQIHKGWALLLWLPWWEDCSTLFRFSRLGEPIKPFQRG